MSLKNGRLHLVNHLRAAGNCRIIGSFDDTNVLKFADSIDYNAAVATANAIVGPSIANLYEASRFGNQHLVVSPISTQYTSRARCIFAAGIIFLKLCGAKCNKV